MGVNVTRVLVIFLLYVSILAPETFCSITRQQEDVGGGGAGLGEIRIWQYIETRGHAYWVLYLMRYIQESRPINQPTGISLYTRQSRAEVACSDITETANLLP